MSSAHATVKDYKLRFQFLLTLNGLLAFAFTYKSSLSANKFVDNGTMALFACKSVVKHSKPVVQIGKKPQWT